MLVNWESADSKMLRAANLPNADGDARREDEDKFEDKSREELYAFVR